MLGFIVFKSKVKKLFSSVVHSAKARLKGATYIKTFLPALKRAVGGCDEGTRNFSTLIFFAEFFEA